MPEPEIDTIEYAVQRAKPAADATQPEASRALAIQRLALVGLVFGTLSAGLCVYLYFQVEEWQLLAVAGLFALAMLCLLRARGLARREQSEAASVWLLTAVFCAFGLVPLFWAGTAWANMIGGLLLFAILGSMIRPRRRKMWLVIAAAFVLAVLAFEFLERLPRYDIAESGILSWYAPGVIVALVILALWQVIHTFRTGSIRTRLVIAFVAVALLPVIILVVGMASGGIRGVREDTTGELEALVTLKEDVIENWLADLKIDLQVTLSGTQMRAHLQALSKTAPGSPEAEDALQALRGHFLQVLNQTGRYRDIFLLDPEGTIIVSTEPAQEGTPRGRQPFFQYGRSRAYVQPPYYSATDATTFLYSSLPVLDEQGALLAVLAGRADLEQLYELLGQRGGLGDTEDSYLVGSNHTLLTPTRTGKVHVWVNSEGIRQAVDNHANGSALYDDHNWQPVVGAYRWLPELEIALVAEQEQAEAFSQIYTMLGIAAVTGLLGLLAAIAVSLYITRSIANPLADLADTATEVAAGDLAQTARVRRDDEIGTVARAFNSMTVQLQGLIGSLEKRVTDRTQELERRSRYLEASAEVARRTASILETDTLIQEVVNIIQQQFGLYYVGLFLLDENQAAGSQTGQWAMLRAGTGEAGQAMLARGHRIRVGEGMVGWTIEHSEARIAMEADLDRVRLATAELPETRAEAALPLRLRGEVLGALTVQHSEADAFDQETIVVLQTMTDQVAVALENARLFAERQEALEATQRVYGEMSREAWQEILRTQSDLGFRSDQDGLTLASDVWRPEMEQVLESGQTVRLEPTGERDGVDADGRRVLAVPITTRGQVVGVLDTYKPAGSGDWSPDEVALLQDIANQLGEALESARLFQETQQRAAHERAIRQVTEQTRRAVDVETILQSAVTELAKAMGAPRAYVRLGTEAELTTDGKHLEAVDKMPAIEGNGGAGTPAGD